MSLLRHIGTYCACTHAYIPVFTMLQDSVMQLSTLLLTGYQFSSVRIPIKYGGRVTRCSISSFEQLDCGRGLDTGVVALVKQKVMH